jgi:hypothetical protein
MGNDPESQHDQNSPFHQKNQPTFKPEIVNAEDMTNRQVRGYEILEAVNRGETQVTPLDEERTLYVTGGVGYVVTRRLKKVRSQMRIVYESGDGDYKKMGWIASKYIEAERLRRGELQIEGSITEVQRARAARRRPPRIRKTDDGRPIRVAERAAAKAMRPRINELLKQLVIVYQRENPIKDEQRRPGGQAKPPFVQAHTLIHKVAYGASYDETFAHFEQLIEKGALFLRQPPHANTFSRWMSNSEVTPVLERMLAITTLPFVAREVSAIVDSTKISQMSTASYQHIFYGNDERPGVRWLKCHAITGVETSVFMGAIFSPDNEHDSHYLEPLVRLALRTFALKHVLADKAYLSKKIIAFLAEHEIQPYIPLKKNVSDFRKGSKPEEDAWYAYIDAYGKANGFENEYRFRCKIEGAFSVLKRMAEAFCWSRGRNPGDAGDEGKPCVAWVNEALCKLIYYNLRVTVRYEAITGITIDYRVPERFFPAPSERLIDDAA